MAAMAEASPNLTPVTRPDPALWNSRSASARWAIKPGRPTDRLGLGRDQVLCRNVSGPWIDTEIRTLSNLTAILRVGPQILSMWARACPDNGGPSSEADSILGL